MIYDFQVSVPCRINIRRQELVLSACVFVHPSHSVRLVQQIFLGLTLFYKKKQVIILSLHE